MQMWDMLRLQYILILIITILLATTSFGCLNRKIDICFPHKCYYEDAFVFNQVSNSSHFRLDKKFCKIKTANIINAFVNCELDKDITNLQDCVEEQFNLIVSISHNFLYDHLNLRSINTIFYSKLFRSVLSVVSNYVTKSNSTGSIKIQYKPLSYVDIEKMLVNNYNETEKYEDVIIRQADLLFMKNQDQFICQFSAKLCFIK